MKGVYHFTVVGYCEAVAASRKGLMAITYELGTDSKVVVIVGRSSDNCGVGVARRCLSESCLLLGAGKADIHD